MPSFSNTLLCKGGLVRYMARKKNSYELLIWAASMGLLDGLHFWFGAEQGSIGTSCREYS